MRLFHFDMLFFALAAVVVPVK
uniref:Uncharacterized protein n=1 Tax=Anguilla anguilla TaxID=7936 RepID=A0A0E9SAE4_ANGAN